MRLTCPNCGVEYEVPEGMIPAAGRHVQCTSCHTRWFVRSGVRAAASEDQILTRLESWRPRPPPVAMPVVAVAGPAPAEPEPALEAEAEEPAPVAEPAPEAVATEPSPPRPVPPADSPPLPPARPAPRLDLGGNSTRPEPMAPAPSRFGRGLVAALLLALLALGAYLYRGPIVQRVPASGPALAAYASYVDQTRGHIARRYAELKERTGI